MDNFLMESEYYELVPELREGKRMLDYATTPEEIDMACAILHVATTKIMYIKKHHKGFKPIVPIDEEPKTLLKHIRDYIARRKKNG